MPFYRKKPVVIEARQIDMNDHDEALAIAAWAGADPVGEDYEPHVMRIPTLEGPLYADDGDYIIRGVAGEFSACKPDIFNRTYESVLP
jgi:hypothetical protein